MFFDSARLAEQAFKPRPSRLVHDLRHIHVRQYSTMRFAAWRAVSRFAEREGYRSAAGLGDARDIRIEVDR